VWKSLAAEATPGLSLALGTEHTQFSSTCTQTRLPEDDEADYVKASQGSGYQDAVFRFSVNNI